MRTDGKSASALFADGAERSAVIGELFEIVSYKDLNNLLEELGDFWVALSVFLYRRFDVNIPIFGFGAISFAKWSYRISIWREAIYTFSEGKIEFSPNFLTGGSNYNKTEKVMLVLEKALGRKPDDAEVFEMELIISNILDS